MKREREEGWKLGGGDEVEVEITWEEKKMKKLVQTIEHEREQMRGGRRGKEGGDA